MKPRKPLLLALLALALLALAGCGESTPDVSEITTATSATAATATAPLPTTYGFPDYSEPMPGETRLENGHIGGLGYIAGLREIGDVRWIDVAYVEILTGEEAKAAAIEDGELQPGDNLPNDYYIHKTAQIPEGVTEVANRWETPAFVLAPTVMITVFTWSDGGEQTVTWEQLTSFFSKFGQTPPEGSEHLADAIWYIERDEIGDVVVISEYVMP